MKNTLLIACLMLAALFIKPATALPTGGKFEGVITYNISFPNSGFTEQQLAMFPKTMVLSIKGGSSRNESSSSMGTMVEITNADQKFTVSLLNIMGKKLAIRKTMAELSKDLSQEAKPSVVLSPETKMIAGYSCKKAVITVEKNGKKTTFEIWYSPDLGGRESNFGNPVYQDIDGVLMEFTLQERNYTMKYSAASVEKKSIDDSQFQIPADYTLTTEQELKQMFGGGMQ
jgi:GLPGLI family protein